MTICKITIFAYTTEREFIVMDRKKKQISGIKSLIRGLDGLLEVLLLLVLQLQLLRLSELLLLELPLLDSRGLL